MNRSSAFNRSGAFKWSKTMSYPVSAGAAGLSMMQDWPVNQPEKTAPANTLPAIALPEPSPQNQPLQQRRITELPTELLVMIFDYLEFDDIRQVNGTCLAFREVVKEFNYIQELSYFARLPQHFREQYQKVVPWQKKYLRLHPFAASAPLNDRVISFRERKVKNLPQTPALLCLSTLGRMEQCPAYRLVERFKVALPLNARIANSQAAIPYDVCFSPSGCHLLFYGYHLNDTRLLARDDRGQWAEEHLNWSDNSERRVITEAKFSACTNRLSTCSEAPHCVVNTFRPAHSGWDDVGTVTLRSDQVVEFSPSGKYMVACSSNNPVIVWRMEDNGWLKMEVRGLDPKTPVVTALFSPSEQYLALLHMKQMTMLALDDHGACSAQPLELLTEGSIDYATFSQMKNQLLVGIDGDCPHSRRVSIYRPKPSGIWEKTTIFSDFRLIYFSHVGNYLFSNRERDVLLWRISEEWPDRSLDDLLSSPPEAASRGGGDSAIKLHHNFRVESVLFSPSDRHILVSGRDGCTYCIWGRSRADEWSLQTHFRQCPPLTSYHFSLSGLHALTYNVSKIEILGHSDQRRWSLKGVIKQDRIMNACFNPLAEHEVLAVSLTMAHGIPPGFTLHVWEINDSGKPIPAASSTQSSNEMAEALPNE
ncbi:F-box/WD repeat-containing protein [Endozoicomonas sp. SCSIO W0465]|uniref:F-box/WD repeat-containing protein n=1 Tax=Endozoicomonas sp. SCSIO W0465 TaxID=2918516 RepID=UPI0020751985|nr:F-box/WD40 repeat-containing protein [Endozoicomonas sp. SCSIO W0465]USE37346.1 F-box/WD repeat-containing protein [Endozoicomonas sp. SCSIO W0465]